MKALDGTVLLDDTGTYCLDGQEGDGPGGQEGAI